MDGDLKGEVLLGSNTPCSGAEPSWAKDSTELSHQLHRGQRELSPSQPHPNPYLGISTVEQGITLC